jgi:histidinol-phosphate aminotransferase
MGREATHTSELARPSVRGLTPYVPGRPITEIEREFGIHDVIKLASNENPHGPSPAALEAMRAALGESCLYPDNNAHALKEALSRHLSIERECISIGNGSNELLFLLADVFLDGGASALYSQFGFSTYRIAVAKSGARAIEVPALARDSAMPLGHDLPAIASAIAADSKLLYIANPNNPTGTWANAPEVKQLIERVPTHTIVALDEAYLEFGRERGSQDALSWLTEHPNLVILRTFSKAYGLAGLRVGYALSHPEIAGLLNRVRPAFNVNSVAQAGAIAALADQAYMRRAVAVTLRELDRVRGELAALGLWAAPSAGNFLLVDLGSEALSTHHALLRHGVIVRPVADYGLAPYLRISIGLPEQNDRLLAALRERTQGSTRDSTSAAR